MGEASIGVLTGGISVHEVMKMERKIIKGRDCNGNILE
jgi:hypothetical protein